MKLIKRKRENEKEKKIVCKIKIKTSNYKSNQSGIYEKNSSDFINKRIKL